MRFVPLAIVGLYFAFGGFIHRRAFAVVGGSVFWVWALWASGVMLPVCRNYSIEKTVVGVLLLWAPLAAWFAFLQLFEKSAFVLWASAEDARVAFGLACEKVGALPAKATFFAGPGFAVVTAPRASRAWVDALNEPMNRYLELVHRPVVAWRFVWIAAAFLMGAAFLDWNNIRT